MRHCGTLFVQIGYIFVVCICLYLFMYMVIQINYIILYNKTYAKIYYKSYNNYKCPHRNKTNNLPIKKISTYLINCNKRIEKNVLRDNDSNDGTV